VLLLDAWVIGGASPTVALLTVPPTMLLGAALSITLLARSFRAPWLLHGAAPIALAGAALIATQHSVLGSTVAMAIHDRGGKAKSEDQGRQAHQHLQHFVPHA
jgi:hypothetical protein